MNRRADSDEEVERRVEYSVIDRVSKAGPLTALIATFLPQFFVRKAAVNPAINLMR